MKPKVQQLSQPTYEQLLEHLTATVQANGSRGAAVVAIVLDGLQAIVLNARAGDRESRAGVKRIRGLLREIEAIASIELPGDDS